MKPESLSAGDLERLRATGIDAAEAERQLALLRRPPPPARLVRPATPGDGLLRLDERRQGELREVGEAARRAGRLTKFVPASGAATRMFRSLIATRAAHPTADLRALRELARDGDAAARESVAFFEALPRLALAGPLAAALGLPADGDPERLLHDVPVASLLAALLDPAGLDAARLPKALLPFHRAPEGARTAFVEQIVEGAAWLAGDDGRARFHFTIPPGSAGAFGRELESAAALLHGRVTLDVTFSEQSRATDTLALEVGGRPSRTADGELLLRPSGHGALLANLERCGGDLALVKNIDNVLPETRHAEIAHWKLVLAGLLVEAAGRPDGGTPRPTRVCGVVPNSGEPGGGPFWVADPAGHESLQIVEASQVDFSDDAQDRVWHASTHFNPVDLACALRSPAGASFELASFVDPATAFVTTKSEGGRDLWVLERPGLWNGAMAGWRTIFVEVPGSTFAPVKSVLDLARPEHAAD